MLIYIAGPYSADTEQGRKDNIRAAGLVAARLWERGHAVICPHTNTSEFELIGCEATYEQYLAGDFKIIARCDALVLMPDWAKSKGATLEFEYATSLGIPSYTYPHIPDLHPSEIRAPQQATSFAEILGKMYRTHLEKNADYSPANILATGEVGLVTRLWDKTARLLNLMGFRFTITAAGTYDSPRSPKNESIDDTYQDMAVYAIIGLLLRQNKWGK